MGSGVSWRPRGDLFVQPYHHLLGIKHPLPVTLRLVSLTRIPKEAANHSAWDQSGFFPSLDIF